jgi:hypothetical protein
MTSATLKALVEVYGTLVRAGWDDPDHQDVEPTVSDHETAEQPSEVEQSAEVPASHSAHAIQKHETTV